MIVPLLGLLLAACQAGGDEPGAGPTQAFDAIAPSETITFIGTEPFWSGEIEGGVALYASPERPDGIRFEVDRFAGNNGLAFTGTLDGAPFDLTITPGTCSDGMSDRSYPYTATLRLGDEQRNGCAWTDAQPFGELDSP